MPRSSLVDFKAVKTAITMQQLLEHYGLFEGLRKTGDNLSGPCPIHKGSNPTQFRVSLSKNIWNCFSDCKGGGNALDFIARMENISIHAAALKAIEWFHLDPEAMSSNAQREAHKPSEPREPRANSERKATANQLAAPDGSASNKPLGFRLDKLQTDHTYLTERGLSVETIEAFGLGFCTKGMLKDRIAIPIHNSQGAVVAYAGRFPGEPPGDVPKYKLPQGFRKSLELFNIDRAIKEPNEEPLVIVEGFFGCMHLWQHGCRKVVALMGCTLSDAQEELIRQHTDARSRIVVMLDHDEAGRAGAEEIVTQLAKFVFVKMHTFLHEDQEPESLLAEDVAELFI